MRRAALALIALGLPASALAQTPALPAPTEVAPDLRPCIDYVGRGALHSVGEPEPLGVAHPMLGYANYRYRYHFDEHAALIGQAPWQSVDLAREAKNLRTANADDVLVFLQFKEGQPVMVDWRWIWKDRKGREFLPVFLWPTTGRRSEGWEPLAVHGFAHPVSYRDPQPWWPELPMKPDDYRKFTKNFDVSRGRVRVRYGIYLSDLPAVLAAAGEEQCGR